MPSSLDNTLLIGDRCNNDDMYEESDDHFIGNYPTASTSSVAHDREINLSYSPSKSDEERLLQATVFLEDALEYRTIHHKVDLKHLKEYRIYYSSLVQWCLSVTVFVIHVLAFFERPTSLTLSSDVRYHGVRPEIPCGITESIELLCLLIFAADIYVKVRVIGGKRYLRRKWLLAYSLIVLISLIDWLVTCSSLCLEPVRFRRIFRPFFLLQNSSIMKKTVNCIKRSLPQIGGVLLVLCFHLYFFTMFGMLLFPVLPKSSAGGNMTTESPPVTAPVTPPGHRLPASQAQVVVGADRSVAEDEEARQHFRTLEGSFISLLVLLTTANNPDVMIDAYKSNRFYALYFIVFLVIGLYCLLNMVTAITYNMFRGYFLNSMESSLFRQRLALRAVFEVLRSSASRQTVTLINGPPLQGDDTASISDLSFIISRSNLKSQTKQTLTKEVEKCILSEHQLYLHDFMDFFRVLHRPVERRRKPSIVLSHHPSLHTVQRVILHRFSTYFGHLVTVINVTVVTIFLSLEYSESVDSPHALLHLINLVFIIYYTLEHAAHIWANGFARYYHRKSNQFDTLITFALIIVEILYLALFGLPVEGFDHPSGLPGIAVFDIVRITNMFIILKMFRIIPSIKTMSIIFDALIDLIRNLRAFAGILVVVFYSFAILGMELFNGVIKYDAGNITSNETRVTYLCGSYQQLEYWPNNFDDFAASLIVLWDLMVVNNWHVFLAAYKQATHSSWAHLYFISWYVVSVIIVLNLFTALIIENFIMKWDKLFPPSDSTRPRSASHSSYINESTEQPLHRVYTMQEMFREMCEEPSEEDIVNELREHDFINFNI